ncbi:WD40-repeat-containing domain protein [Radiomyces spectabilis]|uniref:WD40-repeat-containing domain protein n=1 Tax=Radiomyces spectabilis TaxID=64574 RepID=UPI00221F87A3|nr:WD40-repeat-containing domain protein [Radiomyces spectabilis]KAI8391614.1 WD40-repeat-containing domain protein [Radiomyces spectabilis]
MISAIQWIRKGVAARHPEKYNLDDKEYERISQLAAEQLEDAKEDLKEAEAMAVDKEEQAPKTAASGDELAEYNLDAYDDEIAADKNKKVGIFSNIKDLAYYDNDEQDPYITLTNNNEDDEEKQELEVLPTDNMLLAAKTEDDISHLEIHIFEGSEDNLYVHHDIMLPAFPLCLEWLDFHTGTKKGQESSGNYIAIGTFEPDIEIWNLDMIDVMYPETILGHTDKGKKRSKKVNAQYHVDAIMDLSWNKHHRNFLLSSSADGTVKLWDLSISKCMQSYTHHTDKVQSVAWHPTEPTVFMSGSYDQTVCVLDARSPDHVKRWKLNSDVESLRWDPHNPNCFYVATEDGMVQYFDVRSSGDNGVGGKALFTLQAHDCAVSAMDVSPIIPGCLTTGGTDKQIKIWNTADNRPSMVTSRNFELGKIFCAQFCPDSPFQLSIAGSNGKLHVWDMSSNAGVRQAFKDVKAFATVQATEEKKPITLEDDDEEESEDEQDERADRMGVVDEDDDEEMDDN